MNKLEDTLPIVPNIKKEYEEYSLKGKRKLQPEEDKVIEAIQRIHKNIGWDATDDRVSINRYNEYLNRSVFAVSKDGKIVGYATARKDSDKNYYLSFIAVDKEKQSTGIGRNILLRVLEKVKKKGGEIVTLEFEEDDKLREFYMHAKIPYNKTLTVNVGNFRTGKIKNKVKYDLKESVP